MEFPSFLSVAGGRVVVFEGVAPRSARFFFSCILGEDTKCLFFAFELPFARGREDWPRVLFCTSTLAVLWRLVAPLRGSSSSGLK